jgi:probable F420-dependent oxidoreductase
MREYVECCRAIFATWQSGSMHPFDGEIYRFSLTNPEFDPGPLDSDLPAVPVWLAAVGPGMSRLVGEIADGVHVHAFHTPSYLRERFFPNVAAGVRAVGRDNVVIRSSSPVLAGVAHSDEQVATLRTDFRRIVAFYASTPSYLPVMEHVGAEDLHPPLRALSRQGRWADMAGLIEDDLLDEFITIGEPAEVGSRLRDRYDGVLTQLGIYRGGERFMTDSDLKAFVAALTNTEVT